MIYAVHKFSKRHRIVEPDAKGKYRASMDERLVQATPDGWIEWQGGECPLTDGVNHQVKTRNGCKSEIVDTPGCFRWSHWGDYSDIIAYRPILEKQATLAGAKLWQDAEGTIPCREGDPVGRVGEPPTWDGEGLPPVGCECEVKGTPTGSICPAVIDYIDGKHCIWHWKDESGETMHARVSTMEFRPIRSEEERVVEEMMEVDEVGFTTRDKAVVLDFARALYHAGYRKTADADGEEV